MFFLLFLVSLLVVHDNLILAEPQTVSHECEGKTVCDTKPNNHPQEDVDRLETLKLNRLRRLRRSIPNEDTTDDSSSAVEICASTTKVVSPYTLTRKDALNGFEIEFLLQNVTETSCVYEGESCLMELETDDDLPRRICSTRVIDRYLTARTKENKHIQVPVEAKVDCICKLAKN